MNPKFSLKVIKQGQTQKVHVVTPGAGMQGQALVVQALDATRLQLADIVTLSAPEKLQMKRMGKDLQIALPGGDVDAPDIVVKDYYSVQNASLQGQSISGEWITYNTVGLVDATPPSTTTPEGMASADGSTFGASQGVAAASGGMSLGTIAAVGLGAAAMGGGGGGGGGSGNGGSTLSDLEILKTYANATNGSGVTAPTLATYKGAGVKALNSLSENDTSASADIDSSTVTALMGSTWLSALNSALDRQTGDSSLTVAKLQTMAASYYRILSEADGVVNTTTNTDVKSGTSNDPLASDYTNIGATVGSTLKSLDLLNDFVGLSQKTAVDTVDEINVVAKAAENVMLKAKGATVAATGGPALYANDAEWVTGLTALGVTGVTTGNIAAVKAAIDNSTVDTSGDGSAVATVQKLNDVVKSAIALQVLKDYANATNGSGVTAPTLSTYKDAGIKALADLSQTTATVDIDGNNVLAVLGTNNTTAVTSAVWLTALNSALDKLTTAATTTFATDIQTMVNSYYRILSEADGVVNTTTNTNVKSPKTGGGTSDDPLASDYANIGATVGNAKSVDLLNDYVGQSVDTAVDTVDEINAIAKAAYNVMQLAGGGNTTTDAGSTTSAAGATASVPSIYSTTDSNAEWIAGLNTLLGLTTATGVNSGNIAAVKSAIGNTSTDGTGVDTVKELLKIVSEARLQAFTDDAGTYFTAGASSTSSTKNAAVNPTPTLDDWANFGIQSNTNLSNATAVDINNSATYWKGSNAANALTALNSALDQRTTTGATVSPTILQEIADSYGRILQAADGSRATDTNVSKVAVKSGTSLTQPDIQVDDLIKVGLDSGGTQNTDSATGLYYRYTGELLASSIGSLASSAVDTVQELSTLEGYAQNVMKQVSATANATSSNYTDAEWVTALNGLGIVGASNTQTYNNIAAIKSAIAATNDNGTEVNSWDELQSIVSLVRMNDYAVSGSSVTPTLSDYQAVAASSTSGKSSSSTYADMGNKSNYLSSYNSAVNSMNAINLSSESNIEKARDAIYNYTKLFDWADGTTNIATNGVMTAAKFNDIFGYGGTYSIQSVSGQSNADIKANLLSDVIDQLSVSSIDTVGKLANLGAVVDKLFATANINKTSGATISSDEYHGLSKSDLGLLGLKGQNASLASDSSISNAQFNNFCNSVIYSADDGSAIVTYAKLQSLLNTALIGA